MLHTFMNITFVVHNSTSQCATSNHLGVIQHTVDDLCRCVFFLLMSLVVCRCVRLELLQGVAAFHSGNKQAGSHLSSALDKWQRLQVPDESVAVVASMGFTTSQVAADLCAALHAWRLN